MIENNLHFHGSTLSRNESTLESFRRLDVYPTAQRICSSLHQTSPEKSSPRHLRKQISISEEKLRRSSGRSFSFSECSSARGSPSNKMLGDNEGSMVNESRQDPGLGRSSDTPSITTLGFERLEILSRTPVRALRPFAGMSFQPNQNDLKYTEGFADAPTDCKAVPVRSRSSTVTSMLSTFSSDISCSGLESP